MGILNKLVVVFVVVSVPAIGMMSLFLNLGDILPSTASKNPLEPSYLKRVCVGTTDNHKKASQKSDL